MVKRNVGRGLFYGRDSIGRYEQSPASQIEWARQQADAYDVAFDGTTAMIDSMIAEKVSNRGDIYFDYGVPGNVFSRPALNALLERFKRDKELTHLFIIGRARLARPDDVSQAMELEDRIRRYGITIVYSDKVLKPIGRKSKRDLSEMLSQLVDFHHTGEFRSELAEKIIRAQLIAAKKGFSTGGRPPFGFRRVLIGPGGEFVRELAEREVVRMPGHHVMWRPGPDDELELIKRILEMLETSPASQVARTLTAEGIPTPDSSRFRTDNGVRHRTSGVWHATTITNIARNSMLVALKTYGRRSMGDQRRASVEGPRVVQDSELHANDQPKVIANSQPVVSAPASCTPIIDVEQHRRLIEKLDQRGTSQRGKARSRNPDQNPLGGRIYDLDCSWPMYRVPNGSSFEYKCALYQQSHAAKCRNNHVNGPLMARFALAALRQFVLSPLRRERLKQALERRIAADDKRSPKKMGRGVERDLTAIREVLQTVEANLARAKNDQQFEIVAKELDRLRQREKRLVEELNIAQQRTLPTRDRAEKIAGALALCSELETLADDPNNFKDLAKLFATTNLQLFLRFVTAKKKKRLTNHLAGGVITIGNAPSPIEKYSGPTSRHSLLLSLDSAKDEKAAFSRHPAHHSGDDVVSATDGRRKSSGNVNRGERI